MDAQDTEPAKSDRVFGLGLVLGLNASQMDGDNMGGYDKMGLNTGLKAKYQGFKNPKFTMHLEMLLSQQGSRSNIGFNNPNSIERVFHFNFVEIPIIAYYKEWNIDFHAGASYGRLLSAKPNENVFYLPEDFRGNQVNILAGATYIIREKWGVTARVTRSMNDIVKKEAQKQSLLIHFLTFRLEYMF